MHALTTLDTAAVPALTIEQAAEYLADQTRFDLSQARDGVRRAIAHIEGAGFVAGVCLIAIKQWAPHGAFEAVIESFGLPLRTARIYMARANAILDWNQRFNVKRQTFAVLLSSQVDLLLRLPKARRDQLLSTPGDDIAGIGPESIRGTSASQFARRIGVDATRTRAPKKKGPDALDCLDIWNRLTLTERDGFLAMLSVDDDVTAMRWRVERTR